MQEATFNRITVVDQGDNVIGYKDLFDAIADKNIRRVSLVFIFNQSGKLLLQKRADWVLSPSKFDQSAAGHVDEGQTYEQTAKNELYEELGLKLDLTEVGTSLMTTLRANGIYKAVVSDNTAVPYNDVEVAGIRWISLEDLEKEMKVSPDNFTTTFTEVWRTYRDKILAA